MTQLNIVRYFFYKGTMPKDQTKLKNMIALAFQTAREKRLFPKAILIRSVVHDTTSKNGKWIKDPKGSHLTLCFKDENQLSTKKHTACHGYVPNATDWELVEATDEGEKSDNVKRRNGKVVWPADSDLDVAPDVGYSHLDIPL